MKKIYLNLKRFDVTKEKGGVNSIASIDSWGSYIVEHTQDGLEKYRGRCEFAMFFPELHLLGASKAKKNDMVKVGCQSVHEMDTKVGGNFGAFTTLRSANAMSLAGVEVAIIGHCEERNYYKNILSTAGVTDLSIVNKFLNEKVKTAIEAGLEVLYCVGETAEEQDKSAEVLGAQIELGLKDVDMTKITIAYEPVWAIGPGKTPPDKPYIEKIAACIKGILPNTDIVYGGGLKEDNAEMLASIENISGGLIALTRFSGEIGFYPDEYLKIIEKYLG
ncbi:MAG: triose-phosphate isomerase family protein [Bacillota bacterium]